MSKRSPISPRPHEFYRTRHPTATGNWQSSASAQKPAAPSRASPRAHAPHVVAELLALRASLSLFMPLTELCPTITLPTVGRPTRCPVTSGNLARRSAASQGARENGTTAAAALRGATAAAQLCSANFVTRLGRPRFFLGAGRSPKKDPYRPSMHIYSRRFWDWQLLRPSRRLNLASQASPWLQGRFPSRLKARKHRSLCRQAFPFGKHRASIAITFDIHESQRKKRVDNWAYAHGDLGLKTACNQL